MTLIELRHFLGWCSIINMGLLFFWFLFLVLARDWVFRLHGKWFRLSEDSFDSCHYQGITHFKILIFVLNVVPYLALCIMD